ncbi:MAG: hypothetical protein K0R51_2644 [Cytophagaceae bacterium]|jgi:hypothetical protein|nr:hypothetical protein [Cytophagaceae bacterium]
MAQNLKPEERELIRLVNFFKKKTKALVQENKPIDDYTQLLETGDKLVEQINVHAANRDIVEGERKKLNGLVKENAACPKCAKNNQLKLIGTDKSPEGWKSNKYKCRKCNIEFVWNAPNNPWDMIPYVERFIAQSEEKIERENVPAEEKEQVAAMVTQMKANLDKLKPVVEASDRDLASIEIHEKEMEELIHKFKKYLMIEKIKMED